MKTRLFEFKNQKGKILRGILTLKTEQKEKGVICLSGFERAATTEKKFKVLADLLIKDNIATLRVDYSGSGLSDGDFKETTVMSLTSDFKQALNFFKKKGLKKISLISHSLSACVVATYLKENKNIFSKIILIAPALNQKDLLRYWFVKEKLKKNPSWRINWQNFRKYLNENEFKKDCLKERRMTKSNYLTKKYFLENMDKDYSSWLTNFTEQILYIQGDKDDKVPPESQSLVFKNTIVVKNGDHDLERPDMIKQWIKNCYKFISFHSRGAD